jgi:hypothetical protein
MMNCKQYPDYIQGVSTVTPEFIINRAMMNGWWDITLHQSGLIANARVPSIVAHYSSAISYIVSIHGVDLYDCDQYTCASALTNNKCPISYDSFETFLNSLY